MLSRRAFVAAVSSSLILPLAARAAGGEARMLEFFSGRVTGDGTFRDITRGKTRGVKAVLNGKSARNSLTLSQDLTFSDGQRERRIWTFNVADGRVTGRREDLLGAPEIRVADTRVQLAYKARTRVEGSTYDLNFEENLDFRGPKSATSSMRAKLLFIPVAEMSLALRKVG